MNYSGSLSGHESDVEDNAEETQLKNEVSIDNLPPLIKRRIPPNIKLPETVTRLDTPSGNSLFLIGTAHFSQESQNDVATVSKISKFIN